ncbi:MAG: sedoheptulose 7-phosphate cyclase [Ornithinimicrobium sp.]
MSTTEATYTATETGFDVQGVERIDFSLRLVDGVFSPENTQLADAYRPFGRCLMVIDSTVLGLYADQIEAYFAAHGIALTTFDVRIKETDKTLRTVEHIVDGIADFGLNRTEPVLVVGGGLTTDVAGFACATYKRNTPYIRIPTTLIGLIDASVAIKVAVNHRSHKNRLGAYHASQQVILDFSFLRTLPLDQVRNGMAELVKIATVGNEEIFETLESRGAELLATRFGHSGGDPALREVAHRLTYAAIDTMLALEVPNLHEIDLDRVIAYGHTWSPTLELTPDPHLFHGHAISVDMALSATIAAARGHITEADRDRILGVFSSLGLSIDSPYLTSDLVRHATSSITQTRDGLLRAAVPSPIGHCAFLNDLTPAEVEEHLARHRALVASYRREGLGEDMYTPVAAPDYQPA